MQDINDPVYVVILTPLTRKGMYPEWELTGTLPPTTDWQKASADFDRLAAGKLPQLVALARFGLIEAPRIMAVAHPEHGPGSAAVIWSESPIVCNDVRLRNVLRVYYAEQQRLTDLETRREHDDAEEDKVNVRIAD